MKGKLIGIILLFMLSGCVDKAKRELMKWKVTLDREDKNPYGAYLAYELLRSSFTHAKVEPLMRSSRFGQMDEQMKYGNSGSRSLMIFAGLDFYLSDKEWDELKEFISNGNDVIIFCSNLDNKIEKELNCYKLSGREEYSPTFLSDDEKNNEHVLSLAIDTTRAFGYKGRWLKGYFYQNDTEEQDTVNANGNESIGEGSSDESYDKQRSTQKFATFGYMGKMPNFVEYKRGKGHLMLHAAPLVLSNYFLLQPGNEVYLSDIWAALSPDITKVYWNDYYKRTSDESSLRVLFKYPATRLAILLGVFALLLYILFEGKRKQRVIPIIPPLKNDSVSFVETVGRLYYNKGNHANLANKMAQQFLEWVRMHYFLNTNLLNENFINQLSIKSGQSESTVRGLVEMINEVKLGDVTIDEMYLYQLYNTIQQFYKKHPVNGNNRTAAYSAN